MNKSRKLIVMLGLISILIVGLIVYFFLHRTEVDVRGISATVTNIVDRPNQAEDGYYGITAKDSAGQLYTIDATGYLNTPLTPESRGEACVDTPKVKVGDNVSFNLPKLEGQSNAYHICYKENVTGYYFKVE